MAHVVVVPQRPIQCRGKFVVIARIALTQKPEEVFIHEIKPEEAVMVGSAGIAQARENMPRRSDREKQ